MTNKSWSEMSARERDARVAILLGYVKDPPNVRGMGWATPDCKFIGYDHLPRFTTDHNAAQQVIDEVERRGLVDRYCEELAYITGFDGNKYDVYGTPMLYPLIRATPDQRCEAAIKVLEG